MNVVVWILILLLCIVLLVVAAEWRRESNLTQLRHDVNELQKRLGGGANIAPADLEGVQKRLQELSEGIELLKKNFMKILIPIRSNAEDIAELDDDLARLQLLYDRLKKGEADDGPPPKAA